MNRVESTVIVALGILLVVVMMGLAPFPVAESFHLQIKGGAFGENATLGCQYFQLNRSGEFAVSFSLPVAHELFWGLDIEQDKNNSSYVLSDLLQFEFFNTTSLHTTLVMGSGTWQACFFALNPPNATVPYLTGTFSAVVVTDLFGIVFASGA